MTILVGTSLMINGGALSVLSATYSQALQRLGDREVRAPVHAHSAGGERHNIGAATPGRIQ